MFSFKKFIKKFKEFDRIANISEIGRRVFAKNGFDGILTIMGVILGSYFGKVTEARIVITTGLGACIAMGVSGIWGTYFTERAERRKNLHELEKITLKKMANTKIERAEHFATVIISIIDGFSPFLASLIVLIPFFFVNGSGMNFAYLSSLILAFVILALLGAFLGMISKEKIYKGSLRMVVAGIICMILSLFLQTL
jgi:predicted membrane protein (TIGR00267 family)